jgi:hypothetical protein
MYLKEQLVPSYFCFFMFVCYFVFVALVCFSFVVCFVLLCSICLFVLFYYLGGGGVVT